MDLASAQFVPVSILCVVFLLVQPVSLFAQQSINNPGFYGYPLRYQRTMEFEHPYPDTAGFYVYKISEGSRAHKAGIEPGHVLNRVNGRIVNSMEDILDVINNRDTDPVHFDVLEMAPQYKKKLRDNPFYELPSKGVYREDRYIVSFQKTKPKKITVYEGKGGRLYHRPHRLHSPPPESSQSFANLEEARESGLSPCPICFPEGEGANIVRSLIQEQFGSASDFVSGLMDKFKTMTSLSGELRSIGVRLFRQRLRKRVDPHIEILNTNQFHAFGVPNGTILISKGLKDVMEGEDELAAQVAHQLAHTDLKHDPSPVQKARFQSLIEEAINRTTGVGITFEDIREYSPSIPGFSYYRELIERGYGDDQELESVFFAMVYMYRAGFDMSAVVEILEKRSDMEDEVHPRWLEYVLKHPLPSNYQNRIHEWKKRIPREFDKNLAP